MKFIDDFGEILKLETAETSQILRVLETMALFNHLADILTSHEELFPSLLLAFLLVIPLISF